MLRQMVRIKTGRIVLLDDVEPFGVEIAGGALPAVEVIRNTPNFRTSTSLSLYRGISFAPPYRQEFRDF